MGAPINAAFRVFGEVSGEALFDENVTVDQPLSGTDGSLSALVTELRSPVDVTVGAQWNGPNGFFVGAGLNIAAVHATRSSAGLESTSGDKLGFLLRIGYHPGRQGLRPAAAATTATPTGEPAANCNGVM